MAQVGPAVSAVRPATSGTKAPREPLALASARDASAVTAMAYRNMIAGGKPSHLPNGPPQTNKTGPVTAPNQLRTRPVSVPGGGGGKNTDYFFEGRLAAPARFCLCCVESLRVRSLRGVNQFVCVRRHWSFFRCRCVGSRGRIPVTSITRPVTTRGDVIVGRSTGMLLQQSRKQARPMRTGHAQREKQKKRRKRRETPTHPHTPTPP